MRYHSHKKSEPYHWLLISCNRKAKQDQTVSFQSHPDYCIASSKSLIYGRGMLIQNRCCWSFPGKTYFLEWEKWVFRTQLALFCSPLLSLCRSCKMHSRARGKTYHVLTWPSQKCVNWWNCQISRAGRRGDCGAMQNCARPSFYDFPKMDSVLPHKHKNGQFDLIKWK